MENPTIHSCSVPRVLKKIGYAVGLFIVVLLAALAGHYLFVLATGTRFNETQWAAAGAWLGAIMTFGAVSVAVWQTNNANIQAREAERRAEETEKRIGKTQTRQQELDAVAAIAQAADLIMDSTRRYYALSHVAMADMSTQDTNVEIIKNEWVDSYSEAFRVFNLAMLSLETESVIRASINLTTVLEKVKDKASKNIVSGPVSSDITNFITNSISEVSVLKTKLLRATNAAHGSTTLDRVLEEMQKEKEIQRATQASGLGSDQETTDVTTEAPTTT
ncbi:hypothetical protein RER_24920 [Rhodococcus erythropolis PR4]|uniref:Uncharacterized protein n=1 Tax=Rhodococcus erythropolis (strain PR4 / NBRC 100887) TaxID=234621 RepID=C0ZXW5_RHOE4|nr:hypothetical protein RER_24920 [Rhodococcus erythropolis PR4]